MNDIDVSLPAAGLQIFTEHVPAPRRPAAVAQRTAWQAHLQRGDLPVVPGASERLVLPFDRREKARQRAQLESGREVGIHLPRGTVLRGGDKLRAADGTIIEVVAAPESVSTVRTRILRDLARVAYHLGNRHVPLQVGDGWVRYRSDHVLDGMVEQLGLVVIRELAPFEPEAGAYAGHTHASPAPLHVLWNGGPRER